MKRSALNIVRILAMLAAVLMAVPKAAALINLKFTPVQLVRSAAAIVSLEVGPLEARNVLRVRVVKVIHGKLAAESVTIDLGKSSGNRVSEVREVLGDGGAPGAGNIGTGPLVGAGRPALLFTGAIGRPRAKDAIGAKAALQIGRRWFALTSAGPGRWTMDEKAELEARMQAVWAGGTEMLQRAVEYVLADPDASVPATAGVNWAARKRVARLEGQVTVAAAIDLHGNGPLTLFVGSEAGDRLLEFDPAGDRLRDLATGAKLKSKSRVAAWGHFSGSRRLDLASSDGKTITLWLQHEQGAFDARPLTVTLPHGCIGLAAMDVGVGGRSGLLISTSAAPMVLTPAADGSFKASELAAPDAESELGRGLSCVAADFDGDGIVDIVQPRTVSSVFYRGKAPGVFEAPSVLKSLGTGPDGRSAFAGDWDGDGLLDIFVVGENGCFAWRNLGKGRFQDVYEDAGEVAYKALRNAIGGMACDINSDGRQDLLLAYADQAPQVFFNRGFFTFGLAESLKLENDPTITDLDRGVQAAVMADFSGAPGTPGRGVESLIVVLKSGSVWVLSPSAERSSESRSPGGYAVSIRLAEGSLGPVTVVGYDETRCLGGRVAAPGSPARFGMQSPGPLKLQWRDSAGREQSRTIEVLGSTRFVLPH